MKLEQKNSKLCNICLTKKVDNDREDGLCLECGKMSDYYNDQSDDTVQINLERKA